MTLSDIRSSLRARPDRPHRVRGHPRLGESAAIGHSPREVFLAGLSCSHQNFPQSIARPTADMASRPRSSAPLPCADGAPPYAAASILVNDCGGVLASHGNIHQGPYRPFLTRWGASERLPWGEPVRGAASVGVRFGAHRGSRQWRKFCRNSIRFHLLHMLATAETNLSFAS
jgi:hypothetical protein